MGKGKASSTEIGANLARVRENAGIKQSELARKIEWSAASLSRVESGERELMEDELDKLLDAVGTPDALAIKRRLGQPWEFLDRPALDHPNYDLLWDADRAAVQIMGFKETGDMRPAFERRLDAYLEEIRMRASDLERREHVVAMIGAIGIGKTTYICRLLGLEVPVKNNPFPTPALEAGAGGITVCEVHVRQGPGVGLLIEPRSDQEIRDDVQDFVEYISATLKNPDKTAKAHTDQESQGISREIERAVRNMAKLRIKRSRDQDGKPVRVDEAKDLAAKLGDDRELVVEILSRMELHRRDRRDIWHQPEGGKAPFAWLKEAFEQINNGRHPEFTLPRRIEVVVPDDLLDSRELDIEMVDTKGIDRTATRSDLEGHLDDTHTHTVLCSAFNSAPGTEARLLLERALQSGVRSLESRVSIMVLPRQDEALAVKDEAGFQVETVDEGYLLKSEQVAQSLASLGLHDLPVGFFDARRDDTKVGVDFLLGRIEAQRASFRSELGVVISSVRNALENYEKEQALAVMQDVSQMIETWIQEHSTVGDVSGSIQDSLLHGIAGVHASSLNATVRRDGEWYALSYSHHLGFGARSLAVSALKDYVAAYADWARTMEANPSFSEAISLIQQSQRILEIAYAELLKKMQLMGQTAFRDQLSSDSVFWKSCIDEWGTGPGYKERVREHNEDWFNDEARQDLHRQVIDIIEKEWMRALSQVSDLLIL